MARFCSQLERAGAVNSEHRAGMAMVILIILTLAMMPLHSVDAASQRGTHDAAFDVMLSGTVTGILMGEPRTYLIVGVPDTEGGVDDWAIEGDSIAALRRHGWLFARWPHSGWTVDRAATLRTATRVAVVAYPWRTTDSIPTTAPTRLRRLAAAGRILRGISVTLTDGTTLRFGLPSGVSVVPAPSQPFALDERQRPSTRDDPYKP